MTLYGSFLTHFAVGLFLVLLDHGGSLFLDLTWVEGLKA